MKIIQPAVSAKKEEPKKTEEAVAPKTVKEFQEAAEEKPAVTETPIKDVPQDSEPAKEEDVKAEPTDIEPAVKVTEEEPVEEVKPEPADVKVPVKKESKKSAPKAGVAKGVKNGNKQGKPAADNKKLNPTAKPVKELKPVAYDPMTVDDAAANAHSLTKSEMVQLVKSRINGNPDLSFAKYGVLTKDAEQLVDIFSDVIQEALNTDHKLSTVGVVTRKRLATKINNITKDTLYLPEVVLTATWKKDAKRPQIKGKLDENDKNIFHGEDGKDYNIKEFDKENKKAYQAEYNLLTHAADNLKKNNNK